MSHDDDEARIQAILETVMQIQSGGRSQSTQLRGISIRDLAALLGSRTVPLSLTDDDDDDGDYISDNDDEEDYYYSHRVSSSNHQRQWFPAVTEPQEAGVQLLQSGEFGPVAQKYRAKTNPGNVNRTLLRLAIHPLRQIPRQEVMSNLLPNTNGTTVATYESNMYTAQFSDDSSFYYTCAQDFRLHIFDMTKPPQPFGPASRAMHPGQRMLRSTMPLRKEIQGQPGRWTITDANLSPDNTRIIYSSITPTVYMTSTSPDGPSQQIPIYFGSRGGPHGFSEGFGIWSCRFSADGNEVIAGGDGKIFVYDLVANRRTVKIAAHTDDINSCCWADTGSGNVLVSASDDTFLKVWDRRSLGASKKPSGVLIGHTEGITYVSAKGDGRYVISNGKDQALRLWDLRKMRSNKDFEAVENRRYCIEGFDYRYPHYPRPRFEAHPQDCSVMTYRGHSVLRTLIRCHFSPAETTGSQYLYSGSADGKIHIWSLDGRIVQVLDRSKTLPSSFSPSEPEPEETTGMRQNICVRDVSWHSQEPMLMSAGWDSRQGGTVIARHEWKGLSKMRGRLRDWMEKQEQEAAEPAHVRNWSGGLQNSARLSERQHIPGSYDDEDDEEFLDDDDDDY